LNPLPAQNLPERLTSFRVPAYRGRLRVIALVYGLILLLWSSLEDNRLLPVIVLGGGLAFLVMILWVTRRFGSRSFAPRSALLGAALLGAITGLIAALASAALMLVKDGLHSDLYPDYPFGLIIDTLARAPLWALAGIFAGIGLLLAWWAIKDKTI
jgi:hypothetical protein